MARPGVWYHIGYPVLCRSIMGMYGSMLFVFVHAIVGAICNPVPASTDVTLKQLMCVFLVWLMELPFYFVHSRKIHCLLLPSSPVADPPSIINVINVIMGTISPMLVNQPDLGALVFISKVLIFLLGLAATGSIQPAYGIAYWNIVFLVSFSYLVSVLGTNLDANSILFRADVRALFSWYLTVHRGQIIRATLGAALVPWKLIATAQMLITFLGTHRLHTIIVGYCFTHKGNIHAPSLYQGSKAGLYWFIGSVNIHEAFSWCAGTAMGLPSLVATYNPKLVPKRAKTCTKCPLHGLHLIFIITATVCFVCIEIRKSQAYPYGFEDVPVKWEHLCMKIGMDSFDGEREIDAYSPSESVSKVVGIQVGEKKDAV
ncbi:hypothetical protein K469DRAFT_729476 [Zopfia rhizophila CBS 207.26]|uniref:Uncharacterized protein n=1 Tax=Zopfia rhizophila CBS 207.26 TaxID=1314779 RepID=A0A6A6DTR3_9PEZI|nr:hypothetical protein K469DRAFT_729476 [Zopfia rhizophila CBS 207.26]